MKSGWRAAVLFTAVTLIISVCGNSADKAADTENESRILNESQEADESQTESEPWQEISPEGEGKALETTQEEKTVLETDDGNEGEYGAAQGSRKNPGKTLTLEKVLELSGKEGMGWADFEEYESEETGSGLMILIYPIDGNFSLAIGGGGYEEEPMYINLASAAGSGQYVDIRTGDVEAFIRENRVTARYTGIKGHVKEVHEDDVLISSDTDEFPGVFSLCYDSEDFGNLQGGMSVFVLMEAAEIKEELQEGEKKDSRIPRYRAKEIYELSDENQAHPDLLLTDAPSFTLTDLLSSRYDSFEIRSGNYSWNLEEDGMGKGMVACGMAPLAEAESQHAARLKLPRYNRMDSVAYSFSTQILPDKLQVCCWPAWDAGRDEAKAESITEYYCMPFALELEPGKIYEFTAEWKKENQKQHGFSGSASYVLVTE